MEKTSNKNTNDIKITEAANNQFKKILLKEDVKAFVRILVDSGGCSGFSYKFSIDNQLNKDEDLILIDENSKAIFVTDKVSINFIKNASINWEESLTNSQFTVSNPIAKSSCGCGSSFSI